MSCVVGQYILTLTFFGGPSGLLTFSFEPSAVRPCDPHIWQASAHAHILNGCACVLYGVKNEQGIELNCVLWFANLASNSPSQKPIDADFILDPFHDWIDGSPCESNEDCRALECCSMGSVEEAALVNRGLRDNIEVIRSERPYLSRSVTKSFSSSVRLSRYTHRANPGKMVAGSFGQISTFLQTCC